MSKTIKRDLAAERFEMAQLRKGTSHRKAEQMEKRFQTRQDGRRVRR